MEEVGVSTVSRDYGPWRFVRDLSVPEETRSIIPGEVATYLMGELFFSLPPEALGTYELFRSEKPVNWSGTLKRACDFMHAPFSSIGESMYYVTLLGADPTSESYWLALRGDDLQGGSHVVTLWQESDGSPMMITSRESIFMINGLIGADAERR